MLLLLLACTFVEPAAHIIVLEPSDEVQLEIDALRKRFQATNGGAEVWRSVDAHGGLLRWRRIGPLTATLADGSQVGPGHPDYNRLSAPWSFLKEEPTSLTAEGSTVTWEGRSMTLQPTRQLHAFTDHAGVWTVASSITYQGLILPKALISEGRRIDIQSWAAADPIPGL